MTRWHVPRLCPNHLAAPDWKDFAVLHHPEDSCLAMQTHFTDFVKKYSSASSHSYLSEIAFVSACIGAARPLALVHRRRKIHRRLT